jgi:hypothetical protein
MRKRLMVRLTATFAAFLGAAWTSGAQERAAVLVEFLADGRCAVTAEGAGVHSAMTYTPAAPSRATGEFRCAMPPVPGGRSVDVTVRLAPGTRPAGSGVPALNWVERDGGWVGTASLDAAPEVIVVPDYFGRAAVRARWQRRGVIGAAGLVVMAGLVLLAVRRRPASRRPAGRA